MAVLPLLRFFLSLKSFKRAVCSPSCSTFSLSPWDERPWKGQSSEPPQSSSCPAHHETVHDWVFHRNQGPRKSQGVKVVALLSPYQPTNEDISLIRDWFSCSKLSMLLLLSELAPLLSDAFTWSNGAIQWPVWIGTQCYCASLIHCKTRKLLKGATIPLSLQRSNDACQCTILKEMHRRAMFLGKRGSELNCWNQ